MVDTTEGDGRLYKVVVTRVQEIEIEVEDPTVIDTWGEDHDDQDWSTVHTEITSVVEIINN